MSGYLDLHCHGGAGGDFGSGDPAQVRAAAALHAEHGTSGMLASLVTADADALLEQIEVLATVIRDGGTPIRGIHLEGPFLSQVRCGAQNPVFLQQPSVPDLQRWLDAGDGLVAMITIAPELPGALEVVEAAVAGGVRVAIGHTDASYEQCMAAFERGASVATHLFNGMRPLHHRDPGPVGAALDAGAFVELIADGEHLHPAVLRTIATARPDRAILVTDAMSATGLPDGDYELGGQAVEVAGGAARLTRNGSLAGSTLTLDAAVSYCVTHGIDPELVDAMASANPAAALGWAAGSI
ncbi:N-acetylglucosamine-6-phosphate deacetylase [Dermacoccaceae bacterium W4C1]